MKPWLTLFAFNLKNGLNPINSEVFTPLDVMINDKLWIPFYAKLRKHFFDYLAQNFLSFKKIYLEEISGKTTYQIIYIKGESSTAFV